MTNCSLMKVKSIAECSKLNEGCKNCRMLPLEHSAILLTCIKREFVLKSILVFFLSGHLRQVFLYNCEYFLVETVLLSTHKVCFGAEVRKVFFFIYASIGLEKDFV